MSHGEQKEDSNPSQMDDSVGVENSVNNTIQNETTEDQTALDGGNEGREAHREQQFCQRCGRVGHPSYDCPNPVICSRCNQCFFRR